jgi:hypothetical protein
MSRITNPIDLYKRLPRTNCGRCGNSTCLALAAAVLRDEKALDACPLLDQHQIGVLTAAVSRQVNLETIREERLQELRQKIAGFDMASRANVLGARYRGQSLIVKCLGRDFEIDECGGVASQCHTHSWFTLPLLDYVLHSRGVEPSGRWMPFRELPSGETWNRLFEQRCEKPLSRIADAWSDLFADLVGVFAGSSASPAFKSDISVVLHPLPKVPLLVCYWRPEDGMEAKLHLFFDDTAEQNLPIGSIFTLATGIARMLEKILHTHTGGKSGLT